MKVRKEGAKLAIFVVRPSPPLIGEIEIGSSKNAVLPLIAASLLTGETMRIDRPPALSDVELLCQVVESCGGRVWKEPNQLCIEAAELVSPTVEEAMRRMRASVLVMGPLLARTGRARVALPGGCAIGQRPIDLHLKGMSALGAQVTLHQGAVELSGTLRGAVVYLDTPSVGATENVMMAATLAKGTTRIENAAKEPEIIDLANCLTMMGAHISGAGSGTIVVEGVEALQGTHYLPITDRIEAGTMACAAAITGGSLLLRGARADHLRALLFKLHEAGVEVMDYPGGLRIRGRVHRPMEIRTMAYPGFPTDLQAPLMVLACTTPGTSVFLETVFENRYMHAVELRRMGANIRVEDRMAVVEGATALEGARVQCTDLRAGAALLLAGLTAHGETVVEDLPGHIDRGYEHVEAKLRKVGALIERTEKPAAPV
ncbi:MAG: UDP-N-acetylglucosamine 1-carboxyvinyltransferase [Clostridia bacterium]|nr:UDP-N-acetylglucosamine 1-carboxyvinyltransferase [Clostridia bacterium]